MANVFLSHSSHDKSFVRKLATDLKEHGHEPWLDEYEIQVGDCIISKLQQGIETADFVILVLTPEAVDSGWVNREWKAAYWDAQRTSKSRVLPLLLRRCTIPTFLANIRYADCTSRYESGFTAILVALSQFNLGQHVTLGPPLKESARYQKVDVPATKLQLELVSSGELVDIEVSLRLLVKELKRELYNNFCSHRGPYENAYIYSKTQRRSLDDSGTLEENSVVHGEVIRLGFHSFAG